MTVKLGVMVPQIGFRAKPAAIRDTAQAAEELGMSSLWATDHLAVPERLDSSYPYSSTNSIPMDGRQPMLELFTTLAYLASATTTVSIGSGIAVTPYRPSVLLAKQVATVDQLSEGRLILGVGTGWMREEFAAVGARFSTRGARTDEVLAFLETALTTSDPIELTPEVGDGQRYYLSPGSFEGRRLPIWVGGSGERAMRRAVEHGTTWFPHVFGTSPDSVIRSGEKLAAMAESRGLPVPGISMVMPTHIVDESDGTGSEPWAHSATRATPDEFAEVVDAYGRAGVGHMMLMIAGSPAARLTAMEKIAAAVELEGRVWS